MDILVIGGTRYFGIPMVKKLLWEGHKVTIATRGLTPDDFGIGVGRIQLDLTDEASVRGALQGKRYDAVIDKMGYCSNEMKWILESVDCERFVHMSTAGVYKLDHFNIKEDEFDGSKGDLVWCNRRELSYDEVKRNAERALCQAYNDRNWTALRVPFVLGKGDYTNRLRFYVNHVVKQKPMFINNLDAQFCVAQRDEVSDLLALLAQTDYKGPINGCANGLLTIREILSYVEHATGKQGILDVNGDPAPYNDTKENSLNTDRAKNLGMEFKDVHFWIYQLLDEYIDESGYPDE